MANSTENPRVDALRQRLDEAWDGSRWHSLRGSLEGLTADEAEWIPPDYEIPEPGGMSGCILDILHHVAADNLVYPDQAAGEAPPSADQINVRFREMGGDLSAALRLLDEGHAHVRSTLADLRDADLDELVKQEGIYAGLSVETVFVELTEHYVYHAGQITYIRSLYEGVNAEVPE